MTPDNRFAGSTASSSGTSTVPVVATDPAGNVRTQTFQVSVTGNGGTFTHDANGNMTGDGTRVFEWNGANRLTAVVLGTKRSEFTYDGWGRRVRIVEKDNAVVTSDKRFVWCGWELCEERDAGGGTVTRRFLAQGVQEEATAYYYARDHLGSVRELTDASGAVRARYDYDPYGREVKLSGDKDSAQRFTGFYAHDPSGTSLTLARAYDPDLGRWISRDLLPTGPNAYDYLGGMPIDMTDPLGLFKYSPGPAVKVAAPIGGALAGADLALPVGDIVAIVIITGAALCDLFDCTAPPPTLPPPTSGPPTNMPPASPGGGAQSSSATDPDNDPRPLPLPPWTPRTPWPCEDHERCVEAHRDCIKECSDKFANNPSWGEWELRQCIRQCLKDAGCGI